MKQVLKIAMMGSFLALAACGGQPWQKSGNGAGGAGTGIEAGSVDDPTSVAYFNQTIGDRVLFLVDSSNLTEGGKAILAQQSQWLMANAEFSAIIEGHADEQGTREYNLALGERRANAAYQYLISQGVSAGRLRVVSYGKERPIEICSEESCYQQNRRAVTVIAAGAGV